MLLWENINKILEGFIWNFICKIDETDSFVDVFL